MSREAVRCRVNKSRPLFAANLRRRRGSPTGRWRLDVLVQKRRNKDAALKLLRNQGIHPETIATDKLASRRAAAKVLAPFAASALF